MKRFLIIAAACIAPQPALAQPARPPAAASARCEALGADWRNIEMNMAATYAIGIGDDSAPRATMRAIRESNDLAQAAMTLDLMRDAHCPLPTHAARADTYRSSALRCANAATGAGAAEHPPECDRATWQRAD